MKISKLFHWLYALLMFLPIVNVFAYTLRYGFNYGNEIPSVSENVQKSVDFNQIVETREYDFDYLGVTIVSNDDGKFILNGTCTDNVGFNIGSYQFLNGHQYLYTGLNSTFSNDYASLGYADYNYNGDKIFACDNDFTGYYVFYLSNGNSYTDLVFYPQIFDLTQMFGQGNEPSVQEFRTWFPDTYFDYTLSEYVVIPNYSSISVSDDVTNHFWLPQFGQVGHTINNVIGFLLSNVFGLVVSEGIGYIVCGLFTYWLIISLSWLVFDLLMYVPLLVHRWLDKASLS